jgi:hypothetical protein
MSDRTWMAIAVAVLVLTIIAYTAGPVGPGVEYSNLTIAP